MKKFLSLTYCTIRANLWLVFALTITIVLLNEVRNTNIQMQEAHKEIIERRIY